VAAAMLDEHLDADLVAEVIDRHAEAVWAGLIAAGLGWDVWLLRNGRRSLSEATRCPVGAAVIAGLLLHFAGLLGRFDPLHLAANRLRRL
jgi:hypothetical protein